MTYNIRRYTPEDAAQWNEFIDVACNATFLFNRGFMDYHADRFPDYSIIVTENNKWVAVLPAHFSGDEIFSHQGLTYGSLVFRHDTRLSGVILIFRDILKFLHSAGFSTLHLKMIPSIYHQRPADELLYPLFLTDAKLVRRDALAVVDLRSQLRVTRRRQAGARRGEKNGLIIREEANFRDFWEQILIPNLHLKHRVKPVHTIDEIELLHSRFPRNIRHFNVYHQNRIVAGTTVFVSHNVAHPQYVSGQREKNQLGSLDYLYYHLITRVFSDKNFFDFGISQEDEGRKLNQGLAFWKESFGSGIVPQDFYSVDTRRFTNLDNVLI